MVINKTLFVQGVRCMKYAYMNTKMREKGSPDNHGTQFRKNQGNKVGEFAKKLFPEGIDLAKMTDNVKIYETHRNKDKVLFEAAVQVDDLFVRADILVPVHDGMHDIIEVKADTDIKDEHIVDVSFQKRVFEKAGYKIHQVFIAHANNEYVRKGELNPFEYFKKEDVTGRLVAVDVDTEKIREVLMLQNPPAVKIGSQCTKPYDCPFKKECWKHLPKNNVMQLYYDKKIGFELLDKGITSIKDIGDIEIKGIKARQREIQIKATKEDTIHVQQEEIKLFVSSLKFPIYYFDFETYAPAIPVFDNSRPWQRIPFQYSLHIEHADGTVEHKEFLSTSTDDPRGFLIESLKRDLSDSGSILVFNQTFEKSVLKELVRDFPSFDASNILSRIVDLAAPFEQFHYYDPSQEGRYSIKVVLPLFSSLSYKELSIGNGEEAFCAYEKIISGDPNSEELVRALKEYCKLDTLAEVEIVRKLREL